MLSVHDQTSDEAMKIGASVEAAAKSVEVGLGVLAAVERMEGPGQGGLEVAEDGIDSFEFGQIEGLECPTTVGMWIHAASATAATQRHESYDDR